MVHETPNLSSPGDATDLDLDMYVDVNPDVGDFAAGKSKEAEEGETSYGGSSGLFQVADTTVALKKPGVVGITPSGRLDGDLGSEYDYTETLDF